jgi:hypothetical protein
MEDVTNPWFHGSLSALDDQVAALLAAEVLSLVTDRYPMPPEGWGRYWEGDAIYGHLGAHLFAKIGTCSRCVTADIESRGVLALGRYVANRLPAPSEAGSNQDSS